MSGYILYFGYPFHLASAAFEDRLERAIGKARSGSGMGMDQRDIDFEMDTMEECERAIAMACQLLPSGSRVWAFQYLNGNEEPEFAIETSDLHDFKSQMDARALAAKTVKRKPGGKRARL